VTARVPVGTRLAVAADGGVDDVRLDLTDGVVADAQPLDDAGSEAFLNRIGLLQQAVEDLQALGGLKVQGDAAHVAHPQPEGAELGGVVRTQQRPDILPAATPGPLRDLGDPNDVEAEVAQQLRRERTGAEPNHVQQSVSLHEHLHDPRFPGRSIIL
jgi:hypothetical protein